MFYLFNWKTVDLMFFFFIQEKKCARPKNQARLRGSALPNAPDRLRARNLSRPAAGQRALVAILLHLAIVLNSPWFKNCLQEFLLYLILWRDSNHNDKVEIIKLTSNIDIWPHFKPFCSENLHFSCSSLFGIPPNLKISRTIKMLLSWSETY